ncbi:MAG TPA: TerB family tellurite resistance protein [Polyangiaceae bacterium]|jgi:prepilin-type processing-associated H-X9-DG protein|nr:TerB family tellurite resistance protein [Polyangiaceae bacterium]
MLAQNLAVVKGLVSVAWADGHVSQEETEVLEALLEAFHALPSEAHELRKFAQTPRSLADVPIHELGFAARRQLLQHAVLLSYVDGKQDDQERELLAQLVTALEIPALEARDLMREAEENAKSLLKLL